MMPGLTSFMSSMPPQDIVPNAVDWPNIVGAVGTGAAGAQLITGISEAVLLRIELSGVSVSGSCRIIDSVNGGSLAVANGAVMDVLVPPDTMLDWSATAGRYASASGTATVKYRSVVGGSFDQTLDSFTFGIAGVGYGGGGGDLP